MKKLGYRRDRPGVTVPVTPTFHTSGEGKLAASQSSPPNLAMTKAPRPMKAMPPMTTWIMSVRVMPQKPLIMAKMMMAMKQMDTVSSWGKPSSSLKILPMASTLLAVMPIMVMEDAMATRVRTLLL